METAAGLVVPVAAVAVKKVALVGREAGVVKRVVMVGMEAGAAARVVEEVAWLAARTVA